MRNAYKILVGKSYRTKILGKPKRGGDNNIRMDLGQTGCKV
jgi:hypothetical protein